MVKYFYSPFFAYSVGETFWVSYFIIIAGGFTSFTLFYHITPFIQISTKYLKPALLKMLPVKLNIILKEKFRTKKDKRKKFNKRKRMMIKMKSSGMWLIILTTPVLLSLPVGAFMLRKYYPDNKYSYFFALLSIAFEGFIICILIWKDNLFL